MDDSDKEQNLDGVEKSEGKPHTEKGDEVSRVKRSVESVRSGVGSVFSVISDKEPVKREEAGQAGPVAAGVSKVKGPAELRRENELRMTDAGKENKDGVPLKDLAFPKTYAPSDHPQKEGVTHVAPQTEKPHAPRPTAADLGVTAATPREREVAEEAHRTSLPHTKEHILGGNDKPKSAKDLLLKMTSFLTGTKAEPPAPPATAGGAGGQSAARSVPESPGKESASTEETKTSDEDEVAKAAATIMEEQPRKGTQEANTKKSKESTWIRPLRTYKDDIAQVIQGKKTSFVSMVAAEEKKRTARRSTTPASHEARAPLSRKVKLAIVGVSISLITLGVASVFFAAFLKEKTGTVAPELRAPSHIFTETESEFALEGRAGIDLRNALAALVDRRQVTLNTIEHVLVSKETVLGVRLAETADFGGALGITLKESAIRSLDPAFTFGIHSFGENRPFLMFTVDSFDLAFRGMLDWETSMNRELAPWFGPVILRSLLPPGESETAIQTARLRAQFVDRIIKNSDTRVLFDENGRVVLLYSFIDRQTLVITTNTATFEEIIARHRERRVQ